MKKFMKWMPISMMILGSMFMFAACSDDNEPTTPEEPGTETPGAKVSIQLGYESIEVEAAGGSAEVTYTLKNAGTNPKISGTSDQDWITDIQAADGKVTMSVAANTETADRTAKVTLTYSDDEKNAASAELTVTQGAKAEEKFTITLGEPGSTYLPFKITPKDMSASYFIGWRPTAEMEGFVSDEALFNSDMSIYQQYAEQSGMSLQQFLEYYGLVTTGELENACTLLSPSTDYSVYCYAIENGSLASPVSKVTGTTSAPAPVDNKITITVTNTNPNAVTFDISATTPDAYVLAIFDGGYSDAEIESTLLGLDDQYLTAGSYKNMPVNGSLEENHEYAVAAIGRAGNTVTTQMFITRFTTSEAEELQMELTTLAFDGDELAAHLGDSELAGSPWVLHNVATNGMYALTLAFEKNYIDQVRAGLEAEVGPVSDEDFCYALIVSNIDNADMGSPLVYQVEEGLTLQIFSLASMDSNLSNYKTGSTIIEVSKDNYSPAEEIDKFLSRSAANAFGKKSVHLDVKTTVTSMKKVLGERRSTFPLKVSAPVKGWR